MGLWARKPAAARAAGAVAGVATFSAAPPDLLIEADVVIVAVRDDAIAEVAAMLVGTGLVTGKHVLVHCSGAISAEDAFAGVRDQVGGVATMHPLRAIADGRLAMRSLDGTVFGVEGDERGRDAASRLVEAIGGTHLSLTGETMAAYHAAAAIASNYLVAVIDAAAEAMAASGADPDEVLGALIPLASGALANVGEKGTAAGLTGPIRRGDTATVARHLEALSSISPQLDELYRALGQRTVDIARRAGDATDADLDAISALLDGSAAAARA